MRWWAITATELRRLFRDRGNIFFVLIFPLLLVVLIGASFGGASGGARVGIVDEDGGSAAAELTRALEGREAVQLVEVSDADALQDQVSRGVLSAGVVVPAGASRALADATGVELAYIGRQDGSATTLAAVVEGAVGDLAAVADASAAVADAAGIPPVEAREVAEQVAAVVPGVAVTATEIAVEDGLAQEFEGLGQFDLGASSQLFLFTFLTALAGGAALIQSRQLGVARRMLSTSTPPGVVLTGMAGGRIAVALFQALYIVVTTALLFRVDWGDPVGTTVVVGLFCLVAGGAGVLLGATLRNESQAGGVGVGVGLGLAALGGSMVPLEVFPEGVRRVAMVTPHAWANRAMAELVRRDGTLADVATEVAVLAGFAVVLLTLGTVLLRRTLTR